MTVLCRIPKGSPKIPILNLINPIPYIDTNFFKTHSNIVLPSPPDLPRGPFPVGLHVVCWFFQRSSSQNGENVI